MDVKNLFGDLWVICLVGSWYSVKCSLVRWNELDEFTLIHGYTQAPNLIVDGYLHSLSTINYDYYFCKGEPERQRVWMNSAIQLHPVAGIIRREVFSTICWDNDTVTKKCQTPNPAACR